MTYAVFARAGTPDLPIEGSATLARWQVPANDYSEAVGLVRDSGVKGPLFALIEGGPPQIVVPAGTKEAV
jgi:hypothetical protein